MTQVFTTRVTDEFGNRAAAVHQLHDRVTVERWTLRDGRRLPLTSHKYETIEAADAAFAATVEAEQVRADTTCW